MAAFQFCFMALAIDVIHRRGSSNEMLHQLQPKKTRVGKLLYESNILVTLTKKVT